MIKYIILTSLSIACFAVHGQVVITAQVPPAGFVHKEQLWNLVVINNSSDVNEANIRMSLKDAVTGQVILSANSNNFPLPKGTNVLSSGQFNPIIYNYTQPGYTDDFLPLGSYIVCYQLADYKDPSPLGEECVAVNIEPLSPPLLNAPANQSVLPGPYPLFTWMPPSPINLFSDLNYDLTVVEVLPGQSSTEAIQYNLPIYNKNNLAQPMDNYPATFTALDTGKLYAWQVIARNANNYSAATDVWTFSLTEEVLKPVVKGSSYMVLQNDLQGTYSVRSDTLHIKYFSFDQVHASDIGFYDDREKLIYTVKKTIQKGDNYFDIPVNRRIVPDQTYKVRITDRNNKVHSLTFILKKN